MYPDRMLAWMLTSSLNPCQGYGRYSSCYRSRERAEGELLAGFTDLDIHHLMGLNPRIFHATPIFDQDLHIVVGPPHGKTTAIGSTSLFDQDLNLLAYMGSMKGESSGLAPFDQPARSSRLHRAGSVVGQSLGGCALAQGIGENM